LLLKDGELVAIEQDRPVNHQSIQISNRASLKAHAEETKRDVIDLTLRLLKTPSENPPGDTRAIAAEIVTLLGAFGIEAAVYPSQNEIHNVVARVRGRSEGGRLVLNGHLDTFPLGNASQWSVPPTGLEREGKLYGLGVSDMKGGVAASIFALRHLAAARDSWPGEVVATFAGDEETMGVLGTQFLLDTVPEARGDAVICADAGSPKVLRIGEKGLVWLRISATGRSAHAAHVHRGESAIDKLMTALGRIAELRGLSPNLEDVRQIVEGAKSVSESLSGVGESEVLQQVTVTFGTFQGGRLPNLISDRAEATADIRLPMGISTDEIKKAVVDRVADLQGIAVEFIRAYEPTWTVPNHPLVKSLKGACREVLELDPVLNMRVGASDSRLHRRVGIPTVVCGLTPHNMGAADEYVEVDELLSLGVILTMAAFDYLTDGGR
jgi:succinyl-diaminopimelate desuccinylase